MGRPNSRTSYRTRKSLAVSSALDNSNFRNATIWLTKRGRSKSEDTLLIRKAQWAHNANARAVRDATTDPVDMPWDADLKGVIGIGSRALDAGAERSRFVAEKIAAGKSSAGSK